MLCLFVYKLLCIHYTCMYVGKQLASLSCIEKYVFKYICELKYFIYIVLGIH